MGANFQFTDSDIQAFSPPLASGPKEPLLQTGHFHSPILSSSQQEARIVSGFSGGKTT